MEHENGRILAVQWHPELMEDDQILPYFLDVVCAGIFFLRFHHFQTSHSMMARENQVPKASTFITVPR